MIQLILQATTSEPTFVEHQINPMGWFMLLFGVIVLYGGIAINLFLASGSKVHDFGEEDEIVEDDP